MKPFEVLVLMKNKICFNIYNGRIIIITTIMINTTLTNIMSKEKVDKLAG